VTRGRCSALTGGLLVACFASHPAGAPQQPSSQNPVFRASVEVTSIDVGVVDGQGKPVIGLGPTDFTVQIDGQSRRVMRADWISLVTAPRPDLPPPPSGYSTNTNATGGRLILIVIDQPNIRLGGALGIRKAVNTFVDHLQPTDRVAAVGIGPGPPSTPFTRDRDLVKNTIAKMAGSRSVGGASRYYVALSEALAIDRNEPGMLEAIQARECLGEPPGPSLEICRTAVESDARSIAMNGTADGDMTLSALRALLTGLRTIDAPKTLVLVSEGFVIGSRLGDVQDLGTYAAAARTSIYALKLDNVMFSDIEQRNAGSVSARSDDRRAVSEGIEALADSARGSLFNVSVSADSIFARIESELSGYYLLGVESGGSDKDGKSHPVQVKVNRPGVSVRSRRQFMISPVEKAKSPREAVTAALNAPLVISALPLQVATFSLQGPDVTKIQLLIHAAVGADYASSKVVTFGYMITDKDGRIIESLGGDARLPPVMNGVPSPLQYNVGSSIPPGDYTLKLAVSEGDRLGTIEHPIHAALVDAQPPLKLSELMVGGPVDVRAVDRPTIGHTVAFGSVHGYLEAYGPGASGLKAKYEIIADANSPVLLDLEVPGRPAGAERKIFSQTVIVHQLPPGSYLLRATVSSDAGSIKTLTRAFEIAPPPVLMTTAETSGAAPSLTEVFLPVGPELFARPFHQEDVLKPETVKAFRERVAPESRAAFDSAVALLASKDFVKAETALKSVIQGDADSTAPLVYLAATFAASGHDLEAANTWQTSLVDGEDIPQIYEWLGDAMMRNHDLGQARVILEEAIAKWPADVRFAKPLALLYATFGQGREAVRSLVRHLADHQQDVEALYLGIQWIFQLHQAGASALTRAEDVKLARGYATAYEKAKGPQTALVKQWISFLDKERR
jgi:VWFA-related protein